MFLVYFKGDETSPHFRGADALLEKAQRRELEIVTSVVTIAEVSAVLDRSVTYPRLADPLRDELEAIWAYNPPALQAACDRATITRVRELAHYAFLHQLPPLDLLDQIHIATAIVSEAHALYTMESRWFSYGSFGPIDISYPPDAPPRQPQLPFK